MTDNKLLQQDEIDALLKAAAQEQKHSSDLEKQQPGATPGMDAYSYMNQENAGEPADMPPASIPEDGLPADIIEGSDQARFELLPEEKDALGEIGNISMGSAATTLSQLLNKRVLITSPEVIITRQKDFLGDFNVPFLIIKVKFKEGFTGYNVLVIKMQDAIVMANLMMGGDGTGLPDEISEIEISAAAEAMNQMIGTASTSLADLMNRSINIEPPETDLVREIDKMNVDLPFDDPIVVISFRMNIEDLLDTNIMQIIDIHNAREQARLLLENFGLVDAGTTGDEVLHQDETLFNWEQEPVEELIPGTGIEPGERDAQKDVTPALEALERADVAHIDPQKLNLLLDIPLKVSVVLGRTKKSIKEVLSMTPGAITELETMVDEPVDVLVNGKLVAKGEVVVVNENFGVKITSIISTRERINSLGNN
jgi:flagellar motor switch protein FliN/FliY